MSAINCFKVSLLKPNSVCGKQPAHEFRVCSVMHILRMVYVYECSVCNLPGNLPGAAVNVIIRPRGRIIRAY